ncbi:hypothetical protein ACHWQZ_G010472 [Mnemiopsis leidyi]
MESWKPLTETDEKQDEILKVKKETLTIDQVVDRIYSGINLKLLLLFIAATIPASQTGVQVYMTIFAGFIPYTEWTCVSDKCFSLLAESNFSKTFYSAKPMCSNQLVAGTDFNWTSQRTSFSVDWGIYCETESKLSIVSSFFFVGASIGLITSTAIIDRFGRKNGAIAGIIIAAFPTMTAPWIPFFEVMLAVRVLQGLGMFINLTGVYCWVVEFSPTKLRSVVSALILVVWCSGYLMILGISYFVPYWKYIFLISGSLNILAIVPLLVLPMSPRFALVRGLEPEAKDILEAFSRICSNEISMNTIQLDYTTRVQNFFEQLKDFKKFPTLRRNTLLCMLSWFTVATLFYGFDFGWGKLSSNLYQSYLFAALGKVVAIVLTIPACHWLGRKNAVLLFLVSAILFFLMAMPDLKLANDWTLEFAACLVGSMAITSAYAINYLYTSELTPTTHRGMVMSLCSTCARLGSFLGIYSSLLYQVADRKVPLALSAGLTTLYVSAVLFLPDPTGKGIPETPHDVELAAGNSKYQAVEEVNNQVDLKRIAEKKRLESV